MKLGNLRWTLLVATLLPAGCALTPSGVAPARQSIAHDLASSADVASPPVHFASQQIQPLPRPEAAPHQEPAASAAPETLAQLEWAAVSTNPSLLRLQQEAFAAHARADYVDKLPDPKLGANIFAHPIETAAGSQRANLTIMQTLPWLARLDARAQQACLEAFAADLNYETQRLKLIGDIRSAWYRLFVLQKQVEATEANQIALKRIVDTAVQLVGVSKASPSDVRLGTVELGRLQQQLVSLKQQRQSAIAMLNRLLARPAESPLAGPEELNVELPDWTHGMLRQLAWENQPEVAAAVVRSQATSWGVEIARLQRRPDLTLNASWFAIDDNRPPTSLVNVGEDAWAVGAQMSIPLWARHYDAIEREASWKHAASHASVEEIRQRYDSLLRDLWEQARAAAETASLYRDAIVPDAKQSLEVDQQAFANGSVGFDRVMRGFRTVVTLQLEYHRAQGRLATALARIRQAVAVELTDSEAPVR